MSFESDTMEHKTRVSIILTNVAKDLIRRGKVHDNSKLKAPEKEIYRQFHEKLNETKPFSDGRKALYDSDEMKIALGHHYRENDHHPEHFENGIFDMDLFQITEMLADISAVAATKGTDVIEVLPDFMRDKGIPENYYMVFKNTLLHMKQLGGM